MNKEVQDLFARQRKERMDFCGYTVGPTDARSAILDLVARFKNISNLQVADLLEPWLPKYKVAPVLLALLCEGKLKESRLGGSLRLPETSLKIGSV